MPNLTNSEVPDEKPLYVQWSISKCMYETRWKNPSVYKQPKPFKFTNCRQFLSHNFFGLDFHFYVIFLLIGIGQLDNDV